MPTNPEPKVGARVTLEAKVLNTENSSCLIRIYTGLDECRDIRIKGGGLFLTVENPPPPPLKVGDEAIYSHGHTDVIILSIHDRHAWVKSHSMNGPMTVHLSDLKHKP